MRDRKDSGIEWIGKIPAHWERLKIKNAVVLIGSGTTPPSGNNLYYVNGDIFWIQSGDIYGKSVIKDTITRVTEFAIHSIPALRMYMPPYIVVAMYGGSVGNLAVSEIYACVNQACCCIMPNSKNSLKFMYYWLVTCREDFLRVSDGGGQPNISQSKIRNQIYLQPPIDEQKRIAAFLDKKCEELDKLCENIREQIDIVEEYKRSVITEAVTKGLNEDVEMKDSGAAWIGAIPAHWKCERGKFVLKYLNKSVKEDDGVITCFRDGEVTLRSNRREDGYTMSEREIGYQGIDIGDLVVHGMDGFAGSIGISDSRGKASPVLNVLDSEENKRYLMYYLRSMAYSNVFLSLATGIRVRSCDLRWNKLAELIYPLPPVCEQNDIVKYIDDRLNRADEIITMKKEMLATLEQYKKSLIYEYVTGKKEVPNE